MKRVREPAVGPVLDIETDMDYDIERDEGTDAGTDAGSDAGSDLASDAGSDAGSLSSDDSIDLVGAARPHASENVSGPRPSELDARYGIGARLLKQMGFTEGQGLGASHQGIAQPVEVTKRSKNSGLGYVPDEENRDGSGAGLEARARQSDVLAKQQLAAQLAARLDNLRDLLDCLDCDPSTLDIVGFYARFAGEPSWHEDSLWEALAIAGAKQLGSTSLAAFVGPATASPLRAILAVLQEALPASTYAATIGATWLSKARDAVRKAAAAEDANARDDLCRLLISQLRVVDTSRDGLVTQAACELVATQLADCALSSEAALASLRAQCPYLVRALHSTALAGRYPPELQQVLCAELSSNETFDLLARQMSPSDFDANARLCQLWSATLAQRKLTELALDRHVYELWYTQLLDRLRRDSLTPEWWESARQSLPVGCSRSSAWLLAGLNQVNSVLDCGRETACRDEHSSQGHDPTMLDVFLFYCENAHIQVRVDGKFSGDVYRSTSFSNNKSETICRRRWTIEDEVLFIEHEGRMTPISLYSLEEYL